MTEIVFSHDPHPQGIVFRMGGTKGTARFSPYVWLSFCDYEIAGRTLKLDFSRYDVVLRAAENHSLEKLFGFTHVLSSLQLWIACLCYFSVPCSPTPMFHPQGPTLRELAVQALSLTECGNDLLSRNLTTPRFARRKRF